jgi:NADPH:quinone reductase-like Zn-dependent oxidoreductase
MKAAVRSRFGPPADVIEIREVDRPSPGPGELLVRVEAAGANIAEWYGVVGRPYAGRVSMGLRHPKTTMLGVDLAGRVEAVGEGVTLFRPGDEVFGARSGAFAEYVCAREDRAVLPKPSNLTFEEAGSVATAAATALQGLRDKGGLAAGQSVLVNGASGGIGTFAVQMAKVFGAEVTGVCSTANVALVRSLGADHVVDYTRDDFTLEGRRYDVLLDIAGTRSWTECKRVLEPRGTLVVVGAPKGGRVLGPLRRIARLRLAALGDSRKVVFFIAKLDRETMQTLADLLESGKVKPVVSRTYPLSQVAEALDHVSERACAGKGRDRCPALSGRRSSARRG